MSSAPRARVLAPAEIERYDRLPGHLRAAGCEVVLVDAPKDRRKVAELLSAVDVVLTTPRFPLDGELIANAPRLKAVLSLVIGVDHLDVDACTRMGILVANGAAEENFLGVAEATVLLIAALLKDLKGKERTLREGGWRPAASHARLVRNKTVGLIGLGRIGRGVAARLQGWEVHLLGHDPYVSERDLARLGVRLVGFEALLRQSDVVSMHVTLTAETRGLIGARELAMMKPGSFLINTARGTLVDEAALAEALQSGHLGGAAIDAFATEPLEPESPLRTIDPDRLILTGHCIGQGAELYPALAATAVENVRCIARGDLPPHVVNPSVVPRWRERLERIAARSI